ncbi:hypothetical protein OG21DRAFT_1200407 [Imleria badia]|nr:hypothetical protein OG21DRAFT_1200407 [Imleria badia]
MSAVSPSSSKLFTLVTLSHPNPWLRICPRNASGSELNSTTKSSTIREAVPGPASGDRSGTFELATGHSRALMDGGRGRGRGQRCGGGGVRDRRWGGRQSQGTFFLRCALWLHAELPRTVLHFLIPSPFLICSSSCPRSSSLESHRTLDLTNSRCLPLRRDQR